MRNSACFQRVDLGISCGTTRAEPGGEPMRGIDTKSLWGSATGMLAVGALAFTYGCGGTQSPAVVRPQELAGAQGASPIVVSCEPNQRALVRPAVVNGATVSQVE